MKIDHYFTGWLKSDLGCLNECNQLIIKDRLKDMIVVSDLMFIPVRLSK